MEWAASGVMSSLSLKEFKRSLGNFLCRRDSSWMGGWRKWPFCSFPKPSMMVMINCLLSHLPGLETVWAHIIWFLSELRKNLTGVCKHLKFNFDWQPGFECPLPVLVGKGRWEGPFVLFFPVGSAGARPQLPFRCPPPALCLSQCLGGRDQPSHWSHLSLTGRDRRKGRRLAGK